MSTEDDNYDDDEETSYTWAHFKFKSIRIIENALTSHVSTVKAEISPHPDATETQIKIVLEKVNYWFNTIVGCSVMFARDNEFALNLMFTEEGLGRTENIPMVLPAVPTDDVLARVLHAKMNALGGEHVAFGMIEINSDHDFTIMFTGFGEEELPDMDEWIGEHTYYDVPWWSRDDGSTLDVIPEEDADLTMPPKIGVDMSFIEQRYKPQDEVAIVIRPKFVPEVISGGKTEE